MNIVLVRCGSSVDEEEKGRHATDGALISTYNQLHLTHVL